MLRNCWTYAQSQWTLEAASCCGHAVRWWFLALSQSLGYQRSTTTNVCVASAIDRRTRPREHDRDDVYVANDETQEELCKLMKHAESTRAGLLSWR